MSVAYRSIEDIVVSRIIDGLEPSASIRRLGRNLQIAGALCAARLIGARSAASYIARWLDTESESWARFIWTDNGAREQLCSELADAVREGEWW